MHRITNAFMQFGNKTLDLTHFQVMGILNVTPDSFSDGGSFNNIDHALQQAELMIADGATIIDIGGESTRPGAKDVLLQEELDRVLPIITAINQRFDVIVSIDTSKALVMSEAVSCGAGLINDVRALQNDGCIEAVAKTNAAVCLMHMQGMPRTMQVNPTYNDIVGDIREFFTDRVNCCLDAGIDKSQIILDPGYGFGKSVEQNYQLLARQNELLSMGYPLLAGISRKSMIGNLLNRDVDDRLAGSLSAAVIAAVNGAKIIRVHDVKESVDALKVLSATFAYLEH